jgi:hypothetical protein
VVRKTVKLGSKVKLALDLPAFATQFIELFKAVVTMKRMEQGSSGAIRWGPMGLYTPDVTLVRRTVIGPHLSAAAPYVKLDRVRDVQ